MKKKGIAVKHPSEFFPSIFLKMYEKELLQLLPTWVLLLCYRGNSFTFRQLSEKMPSFKCYQM